MPGPDDLEAEGSFLDHDYHFERAGKTVAEVSKRWFSWADTYGIDIANTEDTVLILATAVVIDLVCRRMASDISPAVSPGRNLWTGRSIGATWMNEPVVPW